MLSRALLLRLADSPGVERFVKRNGMSAGIARRFVAGEKLEDTLAPVAALNSLGISVSLDLLGENVKSVSDATDSAARYLDLFGFIHQHSLNANVSIKLTQLGLDLGDDVAVENTRALVEHAAERDLFVRIDMEGSAYTARTLDLFYRLWEDHKNVGAVTQSYLYRSADDVEHLIKVGARVRLVKGAYREPREVAFQRKAEVDSSYLRLMRELLSRGSYPAIATHDEKIIQATMAYAVDRSIAPDRYEFQMLYGIRRERQVELIRQGYRMRVYVPFGTQWYGYMMRRLAERPANLWFVVKNILRR